MKPAIAREDRHGWPSQSRPDDRRRPAPPWSLELLLGVDRIRDHALSPDGRHIAFVWDRDGTSDLWLMPASGEAWPRRLTFDRPAQTFWTDEPPRWSPDGSALVYVADDEIHRVTVADGRVRRLTDYGYATASPVYSPDGARIYHLSKRRGFSNLCFTTDEADWPVALTCYDADITDPRPSPDGRHVAFVFHPREDFNRTEIALVPAQGGEPRRLTGAPQVWDLAPRWSPDGRSLAFISNRSGWRELYVMDIETGSIAALTSDERDVQYLRWSPGGDQIAYSALHQGAADLYLLAVDTGRSRPLRQAGGWHALPEWLPGGASLVVGWGGPTAPPDLWRVDVASGEAIPLTHSMPPALQAAGLIAPQIVSYPSSGGASIPSVLFRPPKASSQSPCPALVYPHGGPTSDYPLHWDAFVQWLVAKGYAVLAPNYRGSTGHGLAHQHALHGKWGVVDTEDMLAAADYLAGLEWVNGERLGIVGASYGAYLAVLALARDPHPVGRYKCGVALYGDSDILTSWAQADRVGREDCMRQMGHPAQNLDGYRAGSPIHDVDRIRHPLLILHGEEDDRVHPMQSEQLVEALRSAGKTYEYVLYAGEGHGFLRKENLSHKYATIERFLDWYLL